MTRKRRIGCLVLWLVALGQLALADCPPEATRIEIEPDCGIPQDTTNGGCSTVPARFIESISGDVICGTIGKAGIVGDSDWYRINVPTASEFSCRLECNAPCAVALWSSGGSSRCDPPPSPLTFAYSDDGAPIELTFDSLRPGSHFLVVSASLESVVCGTPYVLRWYANPIPPPLNDTCATAIRVEPVPTVVAGYTFGAAPDPQLPACADGPDAPGVWYVVRGNGNNYVVNTCGTHEINYNHRINVYKGACGALECVTQDVHAAVCAAYVYTPEVRWCTQPGVDYYILWNGEDGRTGRFEVNIWDDGPADCAPLGACCVGDACFLEIAPECARLGGEYIGDHTSCSIQTAPSDDRVYSSTAPAHAIDGVCPKGAVSNIIVGEQFTVSAAKVRVQLSEQADLSAVNLRLVRNDRVILLHRYTCPDTYGLHVEFSDAAPLADCATASSGSWRPLSPLAVLAGGPSEGVWSLQLCDADAFGQSTIESWQLILTPGSSGCPRCHADANADSAVTGADLSLLLDSFGGPPRPGATTDFNTDGVVNTADLSILLANFGAEC